MAMLVITTGYITLYYYFDYLIRCCFFIEQSLEPLLKYADLYTTNIYEIEENDCKFVGNWLLNCGGKWWIVFVSTLRRRLRVVHINTTIRKVQPSDEQILWIRVCPKMVYSVYFFGNQTRLENPPFIRWFAQSNLHLSWNFFDFPTFSIAIFDFPPEGMPSPREMPSAFPAPRPQPLMDSDPAVRSPKKNCTREDGEIIPNQAGCQWNSYLK